MSASIRASSRIRRPSSQAARISASASRPEPGGLDLGVPLHLLGGLGRRLQHRADLVGQLPIALPCLFDHVTPQPHRSRTSLSGEIRHEGRNSCQLPQKVRRPRVGRAWTNPAGGGAQPARWARRLPATAWRSAAGRSPDTVTTMSPVTPHRCGRTGASTATCPSSGGRPSTREVDGPGVEGQPLGAERVVPLVGALRPQGDGELGGAVAPRHGHDVGGGRVHALRPGGRSDVAVDETDCSVNPAAAATGRAGRRGGRWRPGRASGRRSRWRTSGCGPPAAGRADTGRHRRDRSRRVPGGEVGHDPGSHVPGRSGEGREIEDHAAGLVDVGRGVSGAPSPPRRSWTMGPS